MEHGMAGTWTEATDPVTIELGGATLDLARHEMRAAGRRVTLSPQMLAVASLLARRVGRMVSHEALIGAVYPNPTDEPEGVEALIRTRVWKFRKMFRDFGLPVAVRSIRGAGYLLDVP